MALLAFPSDTICYPFPKRRRISRLFDRLLEDFDHLAQSSWSDVNDFGKVKNDKDKFEIEFDVSDFRPEDLSVNVQGEELRIEGHHAERSEQHGSVERHFVRKYRIPEGVQQESLESQLSDGGVLRITARKAAIEGAQSRNIPIQAAQSNHKQ